MLDYIKGNSNLESSNILKNDQSKASIQKILSLATDYQDTNFYLPWYLDFRGRMYPAATHISPQSDDVGKSLLLFSESTRIDDDAICDLAKYGYSKYKSEKVPSSEMISWIESNQNQIFSAANNPRKNIDFLDSASDKHLFLAFCFEWHKIHNEKSNVRTSSLPIYVDGTCNGFQHYSALLRDERGALSVNLEPSKNPTDYYGDVSREMRSILNETDNADPLLLELVHTYMDRKMLKSSIIAAGYGSFYRMRSEVLAQKIISLPLCTHKCESELCNIFKRLNADDKILASQSQESIREKCLKVELQLDAIIKKFNPAFSKVKKWLKKSNKLISETNECMLWTNSAGFPVYNCYYVYPSIRISVMINGKPHRLKFKQQNVVGLPPLDHKQLSRSISPNFIHSIDAAHAAKLIAKCAAEGINSITSVHDSFGTHASNMKTMQKNIRETFVEIHSANQLQRFKDEIEQRYKVCLPSLPAFGKFDLNKVLESEYLFY